MGEWPLVGRAGELARLRRTLLDRGRRGIVLVGPAGVGKTRLARELLAIAERLGHPSAWVTATRAASSLPLGAFAPLLPSSSGPTTDRVDLLRRSVAALLERGGHGRLALVVDDAHLLDDASSTLLHQLVLTGRAFVLATVRRGEAVPDTITALWKDDLLERIDLHVLHDDDLAALVGEVLGGAVETSTLATLADRSQGNVLFLRELVLGALEHGTLRVDGGLWRLVAPPAPSERLVELVGLRIGELAAEERTLVEVLAYAETIGTAEIEAFAAAPVVEQLEPAGLVSVARDIRRLDVRLAHPLYGDVVRRDLAASTQLRVAAVLADVVEANGARRREDVLRVGTWRLQSGGADADLMAAAATTARWRYDFALAEQLARAAGALGAGFEAELLAAQMAGLQGRSDDAETELRVLAERVRTDDERARVALVRLDNAVYGLHIEEGLRTAEEVEARISDPQWRDEIVSRRAIVLSSTHGVNEACALAADVVARASGRPFVAACIPLAFGYGRMGRTSEAVDVAERGYAAQIAMDEPFDWYPWMHLDLRNLALDYAGYLEEAEIHGLRGHAAAIRDGDREAQAAFALALAQQVGVRGNVRTAARWAREAIALYREQGRPYFAQYSLIRLGLALALSRMLDELHHVLREIDESGPVALSVGGDIEETRAWAAVAENDLPRARAVLEAGVERIEPLGERVGVTTLLHALARLGRAKEVHCHLADVAADIEGPLAPARLLHVEALTTGDPEHLGAASTTFEGIGAHLLAAEAAADASVAWRRRGNARRAAAERQRAAVLAARCEGATTPPLQAIEGRALLTPAERETALLAAGGRTDRQVAETMNLSVRTVENRLHRVYGKLGIRSRDELADALEQHVAAEAE